MTSTPIYTHMKLGEAAGFRKTGKRQDGLADHLRDHGGPGERGSAPVTQSERSEHDFATKPPLRLEIALMDLPSEFVRVDVSVFVGTYKTMHRSVLVKLDAVGELPLTVEADLYKWVSWLVAEQVVRSMPERKRLRLQRQRHPQWPAPTAYRRRTGAD